MQDFTLQHPPLWLRLTVQHLGQDLCVHIFGGKKPDHACPLAENDKSVPPSATAFGPHVGAVALAQPCPSTKGAGKSASASVLGLAGHKEDLLARTLALRVACHTGGTVVLVCGMHAEKASADQIQCFETMAHSLVDEMLHHFDLSPSKDSPCCA